LDVMEIHTAHKSRRAAADVADYVRCLTAERGQSPLMSRTRES
jgi:hypothetical protein